MCELSPAIGESALVTIRQIAQRLNITRRAVRKRRRREYWRASGVLHTSGRPAELFLLHRLPLDVQSLFTISSAVSAPSGVHAEARDTFFPGPPPPFEGRGGSCGLSLPENFSEVSIEAELYASAPEYARTTADKYQLIIKECAGLKGQALRDFIGEWNREHPEFTTSYTRVTQARRALREQGVTGLLASYGKAAGTSTVRPEWYEHFKKAYLIEGAPSLRSCWIRTLGYARESAPGLSASSFPSAKTFQRKLEKETPKQAIYLARHGREAWNRKYHRFMDRDYTNLKPGECIVSDHAQVDVAVQLPNGKTCFPWITAWRDFKTSKWLSWHVHPEAPNSDHVFQTFYHAANEHGLPSDVYIDNGKDYRCRDFAGGRRFHKVAVDEGRAASMLSLLDVMPHFSIPRNAQAKTIERDFLKVKELMSKHLAGYRGGHVKERPEKLKDEIKNGLILPLAEFVKLMDSFIRDVLNKLPSDGKILQGASPDELWEKERTEARRVSKDALKLFCMRTSRPLTVGRNGIRDTVMGVTYWHDEWMPGVKGAKVYLRRDPKAYQEAWVFRAEDDSYLGRAFMAEQPAALARTPVEKAQLKRLLAEKKREEKIIKAFSEVKDAPTPADAIGDMVAGVKALNKSRGYEPGGKDVPVLRIGDTKMDKAIREDRRMRKEGTRDLSVLLPPEGEEKKPPRFNERDFFIEEGKAYLKEEE